MLIQAIRKVLERKYKNRTPIADTIENDLKKRKVRVVENGCFQGSKSKHRFC